MRFLTINSVPDASERALYTGLPKLGDEVDIVVAARDPNIEFYKQNGLRVTTLDIKSRLDFKAAKVIRQILIERNIQSVYAPDNKSLAASLLAGRGLNLKYVTYRGTQGNLSLWNPAVLLTHRHPRVDKIICNCRAVEQYVRSLGIAPQKIETVLKGHSISWYQPKQNLTRLNFGLAPQDFVIGFVANLRPLKGVDVLFKSLASLDKKLRVKGLIIGDYDKSYLKKLLRKYKVTDQIQMLGFRKDAPEILSLCNISTVTSLRREGVPRSMIESMANRIPVIGTSVGGIPEIIEDNVCGVLVPPGDATQLTEAIEYLYHHPEIVKTMGQASEYRVKTLLNLDNYIKSMREIFLPDNNS